MKLNEKADDFVVRYGDYKSMFKRSDYDNLANCRKFIEKLIKQANAGRGKYKDVTWYELLYEPSDKYGSQYIIESKERKTVDLFGIELKAEWVNV